MVLTFDIEKSVLALQIVIDVRFVVLALVCQDAKVKAILIFAACSYAHHCLSYSISVCPSVCLSVCLSVTRRYCVKTNEDMMMMSSLTRSPLRLVLAI